MTPIDATSCGRLWGIREGEDEEERLGIYLGEFLGEFFGGFSWGIIWGVSLKAGGMWYDKTCEKLTSNSKTQQRKKTKDEQQAADNQ